LRNVIIVGGGLAGLVCGIQLSRAGIPCLLIEKKSYPLHRVCGEYISNETVPFLKRLGLYPDEFSPPQINRFQLSSVTGRHATIPLGMGGFGISRFTFDHYLYGKAKESGVDFVVNTDVSNIRFQDEKLTISTHAKNFEADVVIGAFGKRSKLDMVLDRGFMKKRSPYAAVKYHIRTDHPNNLISLHNFKGGYCGISNVEAGKTNLCYLTHRDNLRKTGSIASMEKEILHKNDLLRHIFTNAEFLFDKPEVINEISFEAKAPVENHILMAGDAAGMITPLCGNGMAMALYTSKILSELVVEYCREKISRTQLEKTYEQQWRTAFVQRLWKGRLIQKLFGNAVLSNVAVNLALYSKPVAKAIVRNTHGEVFE
jgi:menaquinone-9 beta-reductase